MTFGSAAIRSGHVANLGARLRRDDLYELPAARAGDCPPAVVGRPAGAASRREAEEDFQLPIAGGFSSPRTAAEEEPGAGADQVSEDRAPGFFSRVLSRQPPDEADRDGVVGEAGRAEGCVARLPSDRAEK
jgi:hypothetical protein